MINTVAALSGLAAGVILPPVLRRSAPANGLDRAARVSATDRDRFEPNATIEEISTGQTYDRAGRLTSQPQTQTLRTPSRTAAAPSDADLSATQPNAASADAKLATGADLTPEDRQQVDQLKKRDTQVRAHEQAHKSTGGGLAGGISLTMHRGPDGQQYAVGGEVPIDVSPVKDDPDATIAKMQRVRQAAMAPSDPSGQDQAVAAQATQIEQQARADAARKSPATPSGGNSSNGSSATGSAGESEEQFEPGSLLDVTV